MRTLLPRALAVVAAAASLAAAACGPRPIQVTTGAEPASAGFTFTNNLPRSVNVYVRGPSGAEVFLRQVAAQSSESLVVRGVAPGTRVSLRAAPTDGSPGYNRNDVTLGAGAAWTIP